MEGKGENGLVEASDCDDERAKLRPADIDADVREMERRKRVEAMMSSRLFREELERIVEAQMKDGAAAVGPLLQQIQDMIQTGPARSHNSFSVKSTNCVIPINDIRGVESMGYAKGEKILRCKLAAVYRLMDLYGWTQGITNHVTGRLNQEEELLLVNAYGMLYHEVTASSLVKVDMQGNIVEPGTTNYGVNVQGFHLHAAIHQARPDIKCIIHVHTPSVLAVSSLKAGLLPLSNESVVVGEVSCHQSTGSIQEPEEKDKLARNLGPVNKVMLLSNNGAVCCGETVEEAFFNVYNTVLACECQMKVMPLGVDNLVLMQDETRKSIYDCAHRVPESTALPSTTGQPSENKEKRWRIGGLHFEALMRMLDNAGFRTGYIYRTPLIKGDPPKPRSDVEVPPAVSSLGYLLEEEEMYRNWKKMGATKNDRTRWLNSPNVYQKVEILETGTPDPKKITKWVDANAEEWVADGSPTHSSTPVKISDALQFVPKNTNPKEFKKLQQQIKENRRADKITSGPQSHILEGVTWEEAKKLQDANLTAGDQVVLVGAASKGIIQREFQHNATVYKTPYAKNPFDSISTQEIEDYKRTVTRKQRGESYDEEVSESEALSSSAALPPSGLKSPPSETDEDSRTEPRVLRIETKTAPVPSQAEYVLSDDGPRNLGMERIRCYARFGFSPSPACKQRPVVVDITPVKKSSNSVDRRSSKQCWFCEESFDRRRISVNDNVKTSDRSTQTILTIKETEEEDLCCVLKPVGFTAVSQSKKRPVVRKLAMDSVIDQLKDKFRANFHRNFDVDLHKDSNEKSCEDEMTSCTIIEIPEVTSRRPSLDSTDFTSEETMTQTSGSSSEDPTKPKEQNSGAIESHIGDDFQGCESMSEKLASPCNLPKNLDSFILSELLSDYHMDQDNNSDDLNITHHTNTTKMAVVVKNQFQPDFGNSVLFDTPRDNRVFNISFTDTGHSTSCEETPLKHSEVGETFQQNNNSLKQNMQYVYCKDNNRQVLNDDQPVKEQDDSCSQFIQNEKINYLKSENNLHQVDVLQNYKSDNINGANGNPLCSIKFPHATHDASHHYKCDRRGDFVTGTSPIETSLPQQGHLSQVDARILFLDGHHFDEGKDRGLKLSVDGKDLYQFYRDFDPKEVFEADPDDVSTKAHYDNESVVEYSVNEEILTSVLEEDRICNVESYSTPAIVNENIFTGKKYLMNRYLSGNETQEDIKLNRPSTLSLQHSVESINGKDDLGDVCCGLSEDSAVFSELTVKTNVGFKGTIDPDKVLEWSLSENSKEGFSVDSSGSSGVRMSTSEDDIPNRPTISSTDEFLIKENVCNICPGFDQNSLCNSRLSHPLSPTRPYLTSPEVLKKARSLPNIFLGDYYGLLFNVKQLLNYNSYRMPDKSTVCSYYTLVSGFERCLSLPDLSKSFASSTLTKGSYKSSETDSISVGTFKEERDCEFDNCDVYICDDYVCVESDSELSDSGNALYSLNESSSSYHHQKHYDINSTHQQQNLNDSLDSNSIHYQQKHNNRHTNLFDSSQTRFLETDEVISHQLMSTNLTCDSELPPSCNVEITPLKPPETYNLSYSSDAYSNCSDNSSSATTKMYKDCLKCFAVSMKDPIDTLFSDYKKLNKIIVTLKKKFSKHKCCNSYDLKRPIKATLYKSNSTFKRRFGAWNDSEQGSQAANNYCLRSFNIPSHLSNNCRIESGTPELNNTRQFDVSSLHYSLPQFDNGLIQTADINLNLNARVQIFPLMVPDFASSQVNCDEQFDEDRSTISSREQIVMSARSESYYSIPSSSISSGTETFYSLGNCESVSTSTGADFNTYDKSPTTFEFHSSVEFISDTTQIIDHNTAFIMGSIDDDDDPDKDIESYLHEISVNVSSVSCQTDESFQDEDISGYRPEDYTEINDEYSNPDVTDQGYTTPSNHRLYTIYETSFELSPEY